MMGVSATYDAINPETHAVEKATTAVKSLLTSEGIRFMYSRMVANFMAFTAVGVIVVAMLGVGVAEASGLIGALIRKLVLVAPAKALTYILVFVGILSSIAADAGYLVLIPLAAAAYQSVGRNPLAGLAASFAGVAAVFSVNMFPKPLDGILVGLSRKRRDPPNKTQRFHPPYVEHLVWDRFGSTAHYRCFIDYRQVYRASDGTVHKR